MTNALSRGVGRLEEGTGDAGPKPIAFLDGGCTCGAVRYRLHGRPMFVQCCHCHRCQRETGSAFVISAAIEADRVALMSGKPQPVSVLAPSGRPHDVYRCPACQVALWGEFGRRGVLLFVRVGTLDDPAALPPDAHIFTSSKLPWVTLPPDVPAFEAYFDREKVWPAASLARRRAIGE